MLNKKSEKGKCPFRNLKACSEQCILYRKGVRFNEQGEDPKPFEECALNIIADNLEAMHNRTYMMQKEVGETKNIITMSILSDIYKDDERIKEQVEKKAMNMLGEEKPEKGKKLIK